MARDTCSSEDEVTIHLLEGTVTGLGSVVCSGEIDVNFNLLTYVTLDTY